QRNAADTQLAARAALRAGAARAGICALSGDLRPVDRRRVQRVGQRLRSGAARGLRAAGLCHAQARLSERAARPWPRARRRDGARAAPVAHDVGGQPGHSRVAADLGADAVVRAAHPADTARREAERVALAGNGGGKQMKTLCMALAALAGVAAPAYADRPTPPGALV